MAIEIKTEKWGVIRSEDQGCWLRGVARAVEVPLEGITPGDWRTYLRHVSESLCDILSFAELHTGRLNEVLCNKKDARGRLFAGEASFSRLSARHLGDNILPVLRERSTPLGRRLRTFQAKVECDVPIENVIAELNRAGRARKVVFVGCHGFSAGAAVGPDSRVLDEFTQGNRSLAIVEDHVGNEVTLETDVAGRVFLMSGWWLGISAHLPHKYGLHPLRDICTDLLRSGNFLVETKSDRSFGASQLVTCPARKHSFVSFTRIAPPPGLPPT
jgi:hypothetical protein